MGKRGERPRAGCRSAAISAAEVVTLRVVPAVEPAECGNDASGRHAGGCCGEANSSNLLSPHDGSEAGSFPVEC